MPNKPLRPIFAQSFRAIVGMGEEKANEAKLICVASPYAIWKQSAPKHKSKEPHAHRSNISVSVTWC